MEANTSTLNLAAAESYGLYGLSRRRRAVTGHHLQLATDLSISATVLNALGVLLDLDQAYVPVSWPNVSRLSICWLRWTSANFPLH